MKSKLIVLVASLMLAIVTACGNSTGAGSGGSGGSGGGGGGSTVTISAITGTSNEQVGSAETYQYTCTVSSGACSWASSDATVVAINTVTGVATPSKTKTGTVTITATATADTTISLTKQVKVSNEFAYQWTGGGTGNIIVADINTGTLTTIQNTTYEPGFFPDHQQFVATPAAGAGNQLYIFKTDSTLAGTSTTPTVLTFDLQGVGFGAPSPDGLSLLFTALDSTAKHEGVYTAKIAGGSPTMLYQHSGDGKAIGPSHWSHDGKLIIHARITNGYSDVWIMAADGSDARQLTYASTSGASYGAGSGDFSADDKTVYYNLCEFGSCQIYSKKADGSDGANAGTLVADGGAPAASPDGQYLVFVTSTGISVFNFSTGTLTPIVSSAGVGQPSM